MVLDFTRDLLANFWTSFRANFGGAPPDNPVFRRAFPMRVFLFPMFLVANVLFIAYRASFTSTLSDRRLELPFNSLEGFLESDYDLSAISYGEGMKGTLFVNEPVNSSLGRLVEVRTK